MPDNRCETCKWWGAERSHDVNQPFGTCRAHAPTLSRTKVLSNKDGGNVMIERASWRWSAFDEWCGDHRAKD